MRGPTRMLLIFVPDSKINGERVGPRSYKSKSTAAEQAPLYKVRKCTSLVRRIDGASETLWFDP